MNATSIRNAHMHTPFKNFLSSDSGAVTVDWVVLTAALVGLGLAVMAVVSSGIEDLSGDIKTQLSKDHTTVVFGSSPVVPAEGGEG
jgi:hypothetical protein